ncbi:hypothetical protein [Zavarzinella formosa]|uniref:hypothetical protein n=1 Tax=Zavarzinella formosa TaxID=360055 RepID=UPI0012F79B38|nr:hypothetical protein [Zavarzinella formosa]
MWLPNGCRTTFGTDPDLIRLAAKWDALPPQIRAAIIALSGVSVPLEQPKPATADTGDLPPWEAS